jgi:hypothetical protein
MGRREVGVNGLDAVEEKRWVRVSESRCSWEVRSI